ncbi:MAG TPA: glycosyltransferase family 1 protein [Elusimicrobia bacterium]|nr:MAG: hypothetical protein A2089_14350 [Elusimicrobia bacterium GWD2_63_28]HCC49037.1 glycosyltransferase family 1 protein [Elusimicrobiota bacterium]
MRILFTITGPWGTGAATVVDGVAKELLRLGHEVRVIFPDLGLPSLDAERYYGNAALYHIIKFPRTYRGVHFHTFPLMITDPNPRNLPNAWTYRDMTDRQLAVFGDLLRAELRRAVDEFKPDIIAVQHMWFMGHLVRELGIPYIVGTHNSDQMGFRYDERMRPYAASCAQGASYIWSLSHAAKDEIKKLYGVPARKIILTPNGYDEDVFRPKLFSRKTVFAAHGIKADPELPVISFVGKMSRTKGLDTLVDANPLIQAGRPCTVLLFGSGSLADVYGKAPLPRRKMKRMVMMGHRTPGAVADCLNVSDISVLPSRHEGFGIAALEAMGCGVPVIATRVGHFEHFVVGGLIDPDDPRALGRMALELLAEGPAAMKALKIRAYETALTYSWKSSTLQRLAYYKRAVEISRSRRR